MSSNNPYDEGFSEELDRFINIHNKKYVRQIVSTLYDTEGQLRYSELEEEIEPDSSSTFSEALKKLVENSLATRTQFQEIPPRVEYGLTPEGEDSVELLKALNGSLRTLKEAREHLEGQN